MNVRAFLLQVYGISIAGEHLTLRLRQQMFEAILRQVCAPMLIYCTQITSLPTLVNVTIS